MIVRFDRSNKDIMKMIDKWWKQHSDYTISHHLFSDFGFLFIKGETPVMASFLYPLLKSELCLWGFQVTNPLSSFEERTVALEETNNFITTFSKSLGYKIMVAYPGNKAVLKRLKNLDFLVADKDVIQLVKEL